MSISDYVNWFSARYSMGDGNFIPQSLGGLNWASNSLAASGALVNFVGVGQWDVYFSPYYDTVNNSVSCDCSVSVSNEAVRVVASETVSRTICLTLNDFYLLQNANPNASNSFRTIFNSTIDVLRRELDKGILNLLYANIGQNQVNSPISSNQVTLPIWNSTLNEKDYTGLIDLSTHLTLNDVKGNASLIAYQPAKQAFNAQYEQIQFYSDSELPLIVSPINSKQALLIDNSKAFAVFNNPTATNNWTITDSAFSNIKYTASIASGGCSGESFDDDLRIIISAKYNVAFATTTGNTGIYDYELAYTS